MSLVRSSSFRFAALAAAAATFIAIGCESFFGIGLRVAIEPDEPGDDDPLAVVVVTSPVGDGPWTYAYAWTRNDEAQADLTADTVPADRTELGDTWSVAVVPTDADGNAGDEAVATVTLAEPIPDNDQDGFHEEEDCDDNDPDVNPNAVERCNGVDDDCNEVVDDGTTGDFRDDDNDGFDNCSDDGVPGGEGTDCNDANADVYPDAPEICDGTRDNSCDGVDDGDEVDDDGDLVTECTGDCDDEDPAVNPLDVDQDTASTCDAVPDCDDEDPGLNVNDLDNDGSTTCDGDCDDDDTAANANDGDNDGVTTCGPDGVFDTADDDCDDGDVDNFPGNPEVCDGADNDCDGVVEVGNANVDGDAFTECQGDCDDDDASAFPGGTEVCDGADNDCANGVDDGFDLDGDGFTTCGADGVPGNTDDDCDDTNPSGFGVNPGATEVCNAIDDDCGDGVDEGFDADGDGFTTCGADGVAGNLDDDCDDNNAARFPLNPGATETCDGVDEDCDGTIDDGFDGDSDGVTTCGPDGTAGNLDDDCDDNNSGLFPGNPETIDGIDNDCDAFVDEYTWTTVNALLGGNCSCHTGPTHSATGGTSGVHSLGGPGGYNQLVNAAAFESSLLRVAPGDSVQSYFMHKLDGTQAAPPANGSGGRMPLTGNFFPAADLTGIRNWIDAGAPND